jgi:hypothetical protein
MKRTIILFLIFSCIIMLSAEEIRLKPYVMAGIEKGSLEETTVKLESLLTENGFDIIGKYSPMQDVNRLVICTTHPLLKESYQKTGGLSGFATVMRFGLYKNNENIKISYLNPFYWGNGYNRTSFPIVEPLYKQLNDKITGMFSGLTEVKNEPFGSKKGLTVKKLRKYHYMVFMPYFHDVKVLAKKTTYQGAIDKIEANLAKKLGGVEKVYRLDFPEKQVTIFGAALTGKDGEKKFIPKIDKDDPRRVTFMPYEFMVTRNRVVMLHGKFRIALSFPDLSMGRFMKISSTPGNIADYLKDLIKK